MLEGKLKMAEEEIKRAILRQSKMHPHYSAAYQALQDEATDRLSSLEVAAKCCCGGRGLPSVVVAGAPAGGGGRPRPSACRGAALPLRGERSVVDVLQPHSALTSVREG